VPVLLILFAVRVNYSVDYDSFLLVQPPFLAAEPLRFGLFFFLRFAVAVAGTGLIVFFAWAVSASGLWPGAGATLSEALTALVPSTLALGAVWAWRRHSERSALNQQEDFLRYSYGRLHCVSKRFLETNEQGLLFGCDCGSEVTPWQKFTALIETDRNFILVTPTDKWAVPKGAFGTEAERTEFRTLASEKLSHGRSLAARSVEFTCTPQDWRNAWWLQFKLGGWSRLAALVFFAVMETLTAVYMAGMYGEHALFTPHFWAGAYVFAALLLILVPLFRKKAPRPTTPLKISFAEDAIYVQSAAFLSKIDWRQVKGIAADKNSIVLSHGKNLLLLIPQRSIYPAQRQYIAEILRARLAPKSRPAPSPEAGNA
jgi:hypothetical protein